MSATILNTDSNINAKTVMAAENAETVTGLKTFDRDPNPPFAVSAGSAVVPNLIAESLSGGSISATTIAASGAATFNSSVQALSGLSVVGGIDNQSGQLIFPAVQNAAAGVNTLDDYEEGTFTMTLVSSGGGAPTYTNRTGYYLKVGKKVEINGIFTLATLGTLAAGTLTITGLPFTSENSATNYCAVAMPYFQNLGTNKVFIGAFIAPNTATITFTSLAAAGVSTTTLAVADITNTFEFIFNASYRASA